MGESLNTHEPERCVSIVRDEVSPPADRLATALDDCGAWTHLASASSVDPRDASVVIVPELGGFEAGSPAATDPALVEHLVDLLRAHGYEQVTVGAGADSSALWAANRDAYALVELLGYRYSTPGGHDYDVVDLSDDLEPVAFPAGAVLAGSELNRGWHGADLRIVFGSSRTDDRAGYHLALATAMRSLPYVDDQYHYRLAAPEHVVLDELLAATPVHLAIIDAVVSSHGWSGGRAPRPIRTECIIASTDIRLADHVGAIKMGVDPAVSPLVHPTDDSLQGTITIRGSLAPYAGWENPHPLIVDSSRRRDASWLWSRLVPPWLQQLDVESFPLDSPIDAWVNERVAPFFAGLDDDPLAFGTLVSLNYGLASLNDALESYRLMFDKDALRQTKVPLGFDPDRFAPADFAAIVDEIDDFEPLLQEAPTRAPGLRWRSVGTAVLFDYRRSIPVSLDEFVTHVDIARTIGFMNDYIGGTVVELDHDRSGRVVRQAERNVYLPQPNYVALWGGKPIDVSKIETIRYSADARTMYWKTIDSLNGSAVYDDGRVTFSASDLGTLVTIVGRQQFVLPPALEYVDRGLDPELKDRLVTDAYATFFSRTIANLEALVEGRDIRIGRAVLDDGPHSHEPLPAVGLEQLVDDAIDWFDALTAAADEVTATAATDRATVDVDGFTHVAGTAKPSTGDRASS